MVTFICLIVLSCAIGTLMGGAVYGCIAFGIIGLLIMATNKWVNWQ